MWPTVSYCCMSSSHRKGMNWRHSLIMKIVCIFLNWETSLRLHRVVLLHITWEGKKNIFLFQEQPFIRHNNTPPKQLYRKETAEDWNSQSGVSFPSGLPCSFLQKKQWHIWRKTKASPSATDRGAASLICVWMCACLLLFVAHFPKYSLKRRKSREGKRMWTFCFVVVMLWRLWKNSSQLMWKDRTDAAR